MKEQLCLVESTITKVENINDIFGKTARLIEIQRGGLISEVPLYENDLVLLKSILGCDVSKLKGKTIISAGINIDLASSIIKAIGYDGKYIPLYFRDGSSKIMSERDLCNYLNNNKVCRIDKDGNTISSYELSIQEIGSKFTR